MLDGTYHLCCFPNGAFRVGEIKPNGLYCLFGGSWREEDGQWTEFLWAQPTFYRRLIGKKIENFALEIQSSCCMGKTDKIIEEHSEKSSGESLFESRRIGHCAMRGRELNSFSTLNIILGRS
ncbi:hypothetical protein TNCV_2473571 [Trichonephila clavipes]|nr:hypothetical protein TNCV_2473571 [Trichonephila clavipes]